MFYMYSGYLHNNINNNNVVIIFKFTLQLIPLSHELFSQDTDPLDHGTKDVEIGILTVAEDAAVTSLPTLTN